MTVEAHRTPTLITPTLGPEHQSVPLRGVQESLDGLRYDVVQEQSGFERQVYELPTGQNIRFYSPIEVSNTSKLIRGAVAIDGQYALFGQTAKARFNHTDTNNGRDTVIHNPSINGEHELVVEATPTSVMNVAAALIDTREETAFRPIADQLRESARTIEAGEPNDLAIKISDAMVAMRLFGEQATGVKLEQFDTEALMVEALVQEDASKAIDNHFSAAVLLLGETQQTYRTQVTRSLAEVAVQEQLEDVEPMELDKIALVHCTELRPRFVNGRWVQPTRQSSLETVDSRNTLHFTFNGTVGKHLMHSWDDTPNVVITPLSGIIDENGVPELVSPVDTAVDTNYNEDLRFPVGTVVIMPASDLEQGVLAGVDRNNGGVTYRQDGFTPDNVQELLQYTPHLKPLYGRLIAQVEQVSDEQDYQRQDRLLKLLETNDIEAVVGDVIVFTEHVSTLFAQEEVAISSKEVKEAYSAHFAELNRNRVVNAQLIALGYPLFHQGQYDALPQDEGLTPAFKKMMYDNGFFASGNHNGFGSNILQQSTLYNPDDSGGIMDEPRSQGDILAKLRKVESIWQSRAFGAEDMITQSSMKALRTAYMLGLVGVVHESSAR